MNNLKNLLDSKQKTLLIIPNKYHNYLAQRLLVNQDILFNTTILCIDDFMHNTLEDYNITFNRDSNIIATLKLHHELLNQNNEYANNINYINELLKLQKEFELSNISVPDNFKFNISNVGFEFNEMSVSFDKIIVLSYEDFYPIHSAFIEKVTNEIIIHLDDTETTLSLLEHSNIIKMLDSVIYEIYHQPCETLIICDDLLQQNYLIAQFQTLGLAFQLQDETTSLKKYHLKSLFIFFKNENTYYDNRNLMTLFKTNDFTTLERELLSLISLDYYQYLEKLYYILVETTYFELSFLNKLFTELYLLSPTTNLKLLNDVLYNTLNPKIIENKQSSDYTIMLASSHFNSLMFERVFLVDASFGSFSAQKVSYLLNALEREQIDKQLLSNSFYNTVKNEAQQRLLSCGSTIKIHYALNSFDNKPQGLAFFIDNLELNFASDNHFKHLSVHPSRVDEPSFNKHRASLDTNLLLEYFQKSITLSATSVDSFHKCPYQYFIRNILKPRFQESFNNLVLGTLFHNVLEKINNYILASQLTFYHELENDLDWLITTFLAEETADFGERFNISLLELEYLQNQVKSTLLKSLTSFIENESLSDFKLFSAEQELSYPFENEFFEQVIIKGKIDAIMNYQDYYYVIDYKSNAQKFDEVRFNDGVSNQLIIYLSLLKKHNYNLTGAFFKGLNNKYLKSSSILDHETNLLAQQKSNLLEGILINNPYLDNFDHSFEKQTSSEISSSRFKDGRKKETIIDLEQLLAYFSTLEQHFNNMLNDIATGHFKIFPYEPVTCQYCDYSNICKVGSNQQFRKEVDHE